MAFCSKCGAKIGEGFKFCKGCGNAVGGVNVAAAINNAATDRSAQTINADQPKKSKLLLIALITAPVLFLYFFIKEYIVRNSLEEQRIIITMLDISSFLALATATALNVMGQGKGKRKMILVAAIMYFCSLVGIPSAIMCFIAFSKKAV